MDDIFHCMPIQWDISYPSIRHNINRAFGCQSTMLPLVNTQAFTTDKKEVPHSGLFGKSHAPREYQLQTYSLKRIYIKSVHKPLPFHGDSRIATNMFLCNLLFTTYNVQRQSILRSTCCHVGIA